MTLRNSIAEQRWIAALDQRERRVWTQLVCVLHTPLVSGAMCDTVCVSDEDGVCMSERHHPAHSLWKGTATPGPSHSPSSSLLWLSSFASCCAVKLLACWPSHREVEGKWDVTRLRPAEGAETGTSVISPSLRNRIHPPWCSSQYSCLSNLFCFHTLAAFFFAFLINVCGNRCRDDCSEPNTGWGHMCMLTNSHTWNTQLKISFFYAKFNFASTSVPVCISRWWGQWCHRYLGQKNVMCCRHSTGFNIHKLFNINYSNKNTNS